MRCKDLTTVFAALLLTTIYPALSFAAQPAVAPVEAGCAEILAFKPHRGTLEYFIQKTVEARKGQRVTPLFVNPIDEMQLAQDKWRGVEGPAILQALLPEGCKFIDHKLLGSAGDGIVKDAGSGEFVMLRCGVDWHGKWVGFNISVPVFTLMANAKRSEKWLVGPEIEAVLDWGHGGGTKTTGNHTSISVMNHMAKYGVSVMAIDQPWHGEGARTSFKSDIDFMEFRLRILDRFVHPKVAALGVGHSMGGIVADLMMRRSDNQHLNLARRYKAFIPLSAVVDLLPGASVQEKGQAERWKEAENKQETLQHRIAPGDRDLGATLLQDDKVSALSGMFAQFLNLFHDWSAPRHMGVEYLPSTFIWGDGDYLYVGNEDLIDKHLLNLKNVKLIVYGPRVNFRGDVVQIGHLIFDHYRTFKDHAEALNLVKSYLFANQVEINYEDPEAIRKTFYEKYVQQHVSQHFWLNEDNRGFEALMMAAYYWDPKFQEFAKREMRKSDVYAKGMAKSKDLTLAARSGERAYMLQFIHLDQPEVFTEIREQIENVLGHKLDVRPRNSNDAILAYILQAYSSNLAFREWLQEYEILWETSTDKFKGLNDVAEQLRNFVQVKDWLRKADLEIETAKRVGRPVDSKIEGNYTRQLEMRAKAEAQLRSFDIDPSSDASVKQASDRINGLRKRTYVPKTGDSALAARTEKNIAERERMNDEIQAFKKDKEGARKLVDDLTAQRAKLEADLQDIGRQGSAPEVVSAIRAAESALERLLIADEKVRINVERYMMEQHDYQLLDADFMRNLPREIQQIFNDYEAASQAYQMAAANVRRTIGTAASQGHLGSEARAMSTQLETVRRDLSDASHKLNEIDGKIWVRIQKKNFLVREYSNELVPGYLNVETRRAVDYLSGRIEGWEKLRGTFENIWADWKLVWKERPPAEKVELY